MRYWAFVLIMALGACDVAATSDASKAPTPAVETVESESFSDVLDEYRALNTRLERVAYRLQKANVDLCPQQTRSLGFTVHTVSDYPENLQTVARALLPVSDHLSLRTVRDGSPADLAGLTAGDQLVHLGGIYMPRGATASKFYNLAAPRALADDAVNLQIRRAAENQTVTLTPESLCGYPVNVFFSERVNGHTDGEEVWITSELMRTVPDDVNLALIIAHEMSHAIAGHAGERPTKRLELQADRMALIMMERAGFDIDRAISYWASAPHPNRDVNISSTHPSIEERLTHFTAVREDIRTRQGAARALDFN